MGFDVSILKSLVYDGEYFNKCFNLLNTEYFKSIGNAELYKLLKQYYISYKQRPQLVSLGDMIKNVPNEEIRKSIVESLKQLKETELNNNTQFMVDETVKYIKDSIAYKACVMIAEGEQERDDTKVQKGIALFDERAKVQVDSNLGIDFDDIEQQIEYYSKREYGIKTSHKSWNKRLGSGFLPGTLNVILASQGVGKSLMMCDLMSGMVQRGKNCLFVSLEMSETEVIKRIQSNIFDIDVNSFRDLSKTEGELNNLERNPTTKDTIISAYNNYKMSGNCGKLFVKEYPAGSFSALMLSDLVEKYKIEKDITFDIIFIDYLGIMKSDVVSANVGLYSYVKSIGEEVRAQAVKLELPIISASQLNRCAINKTDGVDNSAISDSLGTAMTADSMVFILQSEDMKQKSEILVKFTKNRYTGMTDSFMMNADYSKMRFEDMVDANGEVSNGFKNAIQKMNSDIFVKQTIANVNKQDFETIKKVDDAQKDQAVDWDSILGI